MVTACELIDAWCRTLDSLRLTSLVHQVDLASLREAGMCYQLPSLNLRSDCDVASFSTCGFTNVPESACNIILQVRTR